MARAMARGWGDPVLCSDSGSGRAAALAQELGGRAASNVEVARGGRPRRAVPQAGQLEEVAREISRHGEGRRLGARLGADLGVAQRVYREMPRVQGDAQHAGRGPPGRRLLLARRRASMRSWSATCWRCSGGWARCSPSPSGCSPAAAAVMSVGPAYQALLVEAQVDAAVRHGLGAALASSLVVDTMSGTAALLRARDYDTLAVRREVTSPGGFDRPRPGGARGGGDQGGVPVGDRPRLRRWRDDGSDRRLDAQPTSPTT